MASVSPNLPWVEKYRPNSLDELISHKEIISTIETLIDRQQMPHLLLYGPPGTGKTSTILACAKQLFGPSYKSMILELNASDDRGIAVVRDQVKSFASTRKMFATGFKLIILDECDAMTKTAQNALRCIIEKYSRTTRFCLICNYVSNIIPALQSRCMRFRFAPLSQDQIEHRLNHVLEAEGLTLTPDGKSALLRLSQGDMRKCLNILQSASLASTVLDEELIYSTTGAPMPSDIKLILRWMLNDPYSTAYAAVTKLCTDKGLALIDIVREIHVVVATMQFSSNVLGVLLKELADLEYRLTFATTERVQLGALVGLFAVVRDLVGTEQAQARAQQQQQQQQQQQPTAMDVAAPSS
ncbi:replication factor C subunit 5 [Thecamonas trahens ATCC 50062]|uniref:Replication factor C subunit 5 n=1 Tax=Thecamonas trahens ATCC 50062 TaxID=461836 RepID=A0A0L0D610_THETB|nr:replication factor C subunit 5 [Thecamonas trahens ATCC 50062]KNC46748.1 replication factor C subunit 5 [Thecamonas trahens ATCC 50062]|eukprot:XP_013760028.1 replication factor C subunit 5 [Thecamonas trahens ATCC 50062]